MNEEYIDKRIEELTKDYTQCIAGLEDIQRQKVILNNKALTISGQIQELTLMKEKLKPETPQPDREDPKKPKDSDK